MPKQGPSETRIVMARQVAARWLDGHTHPEHRLTIYFVGKDGRGISNLLRSFRDAKLRIGSVDPIEDLGVEDGFDCITVWSSNLPAIQKLAEWFETHGYETTGAW